MEKVFTLGQTKGDMKAFGLTIKYTEKENSNGEMEVFTKESILKARNKAKAYLSGKMEKDMMASGTMAPNMAVESRQTCLVSQKK